MSYYNVLSEDLYKSIIIIEHKDVYRFVTCRAQYCGNEIFQDENIDYISVYDLCTRELCTIPIIEIMRHYHYDLDDLEKNDKIALTNIETINRCIIKYANENQSLSLKDIYNLTVKPGLIDIFNPNTENFILDFLSYTNFVLTLDDVTSKTISDARRLHAIECCKILINKKVDEILLELNTLKEQSEDPEDHADIDTIIQMYIDVLEETDYSACISLVDYLKNWPPLLLPMPEMIDKFIYKISQLNANSSDEFVDFMSIVDNTLTRIEMQELLDELQTLQPEYKFESGETNLTPYKKYLSNKLNNECK
jgi:hypothetical protein